LSRQSLQKVLPEWFETERSRRAQEIAERLAERKKQEAEEKRLRAAARKKAEEDKAVVDDASLRFWLALTRGNATPADVRLRLGSPVSVRAWAQFLAPNESIKFLDLSGHDLRDDVGLELAEALAHNTGLLSLDLSGNMLGPSTLGALAVALEHNSSLRTLSLDDNPLGMGESAGFDALAAALEKNSSLTSLSLFRCSMGEDGGRALAAGIEGNHSLLRVQVSPIDGIDLADAVAIRSALKRNQTMLSDRLAAERLDRARARKDEADKAATASAELATRREEAWIKAQKDARSKHFAEIETEERLAEERARQERELAARPWVAQLRAAKEKDAAKSKKASK
jgi:hypothetical protein